MFSTALLLKNSEKNRITVSDIKGIDLSLYTEDYILEIAAQVFAEYSRLGGDGKVAKGADLITALINALSSARESVSV